MSQKCPGNKYIRALKTGESHDSNCQQFLLKDEKTGNLNRVYSRTDIPITMKTIACHHLKGRESNYCEYNKISGRGLRVKDIDDKDRTHNSTTKPEYIAFYFTVNSIKEISYKCEYLIAFVKSGNFDDTKIINEINNISGWLRIKKKTKSCHIFIRSPKPKLIPRKNRRSEGGIKESTGFICRIKYAPVNTNKKSQCLVIDNEDIQNTLKFTIE
jgi:hypothetical protein